MNRIIITLAIALTSSSCTTNNKIKYPDFTFPESKLDEAREEFRKSENEILLLVMINREGKPVKISVIDWKKDKLDKSKVKSIKEALYRTMEFVPAKEHEPDYREVIRQQDVRFGGEWPGLENLP